MKPDNFCYWLQGYFELASQQSSGQVMLSPQQIEVIRNHLNLVFEHSIDMEATKHIKDPEEAAKKKEKYNKMHHGLLHDGVYRC